MKRNSISVGAGAGPAVSAALMRHNERSNRRAAKLERSALGAIALAAAIAFPPSVAYGQTISITPTFADSTTPYTAPAGGILAGIQTITVTTPLVINGNEIEPNGYGITLAGAIASNPNPAMNAVYGNAITVTGPGTVIVTSQNIGVNFVNTGTLQFGDGTSAPSFNQTIYNPGGALVFDVPGIYDFTDFVRPQGGLGVILFNSDSTATADVAPTGTIEIQSGTVVLDGGAFAAPSTITIDTNAALELMETGGSDNGGLIPSHTGTTAINVAGTLIFNLSPVSLGFPNGTVSQFTYNETISGSGMISMIGSDTITLTNLQNFTGTLDIQAGTLQIEGGVSAGATSVSSGATLALLGTTLSASFTTLSGSGDVSLAGIQTLTLTNANTNFAGIVSGGGGLAVTGGTEILSGINTYTSATTIGTGATLALSGGGSLATSSGVADNGTFDISAASGGVSIAGLSGSGSVALGANKLTLTNASGTFSGVIDGTGGLGLSGGTQTLSAANTYSGGTTVSGGVLRLSSAGTLGANSGALTISGGTVDLGGSTQVQNGGFTITSGTLQNGTLSSSGTLNLQGGSVSANLTGTGTLITSGSVSLTGTNSLTGAATVSSGTLTVNGVLPVTIVVESGATLAGTGTVGAVPVQSGGTIAPGDAIGTLHVNGNLMLATGSIFHTEVSPSAADETIATGTASIANGVTLAISPDAGTYSGGTVYTLLNVAGGVSGTFSTVTYAGSFSANVLPVVSYNANNVFLTLDPVLTCNSTIAPSSNQLAACNAIANGGPGPSLYLATSNLSANATTAESALTQIAGDIHASMLSAMIEDGRIIRDTVINHAIGSSDTITVWGTGFGTYGTIKGDGNAADLNHHDAGVIMGADMPVMDGVNVGLGLALTGQAMSVPSELASASGSTNHVIGYANWTDEEWLASFGWDYGWGANQVTRAITAFPETDTDHQSNRLGQMFGEVGYRIPSDVMALEPYLDLANVSAGTGAFTETGGLAALSGGVKSGSENYSTLGVRAKAPAIALGDISMVPDFNLGWQHAFTRFMPNQTILFASTGESFTVAGVPLDIDAAAMQVGFDFLLAPNTTLDIGYDGNVSGRVEDNAVRGDVLLRF